MTPEEREQLILELTTRDGQMRRFSNRIGDVYEAMEATEEAAKLTGHVGDLRIIAAIKDRMGSQSKAKLSLLQTQSLLAMIRQNNRDILRLLGYDVPDSETFGDGENQ